jgi:hypothetical protein
MSQFRKRGRNSLRRHWECRACHAMAVRARRVADRDKRRAEQVRTAMVQVNSARRERRRLATLDEVIDKFGGPAQLAARLHEALNSYMERKRYGHALTLLTGLTRLACLTARPEPPLSELSGEQLEANKAALLDRMVCDGTVGAAVRRLVVSGRLSAGTVASWIADPPADAGTDETASAEPSTT